MPFDRSHSRERRIVTIVRPRIQPSSQPLGTTGEQRRRFLLHHAPLALGSTVVLALFMGLPLFDAHTYRHADLVSGPFPQERRGGAAAQDAAGLTGRTDHTRNQHGQMPHAGGHDGRPVDIQTQPTDQERDETTRHAREQTEEAAGGGDHGAPTVTVDIAVHGVAAKQEPRVPRLGNTSLAIPIRGTTAATCLGHAGCSS